MGFKNDNQRKAVMATLNNGASTRQNTHKSTLAKVKSHKKPKFVTIDKSDSFFKRNYAFNGESTGDGLIEVTRTSGSDMKKGDYVVTSLGRNRPIVNTYHKDKQSAIENAELQARTPYQINFVDDSLNRKKFPSEKVWIVSESGETGKIYSAKSGIDAVRKHHEKVGVVTSRVVNVRLDN